MTVCTYSQQYCMYSGWSPTVYSTVCTVCIYSLQYCMHSMYLYSLQYCMHSMYLQSTVLCTVCTYSLQYCMHSMYLQSTVLCTVCTYILQFCMHSIGIGIGRAGLLLCPRRCHRFGTHCDSRVDILCKSCISSFHRY